MGNFQYISIYRRDYIESLFINSITGLSKEIKENQIRYDQNTYRNSEKIS